MKQKQNVQKQDSVLQSKSQKNEREINSNKSPFDEDNSFKILVTTDNHMGFKETDPLVGEDSFNSFEECLKIANDENVDFVLLGGDLFHEQRPSQQSYLKASKIFNQHVFSTNFNDCTQEARTFSKRMNNLPVKKHLFNTLWFEKANFMNSSLGIRLPIFSIHGNHDDPVGLDLISSLDQASANHYVNYFGKIKNLENLEVTPVLFQKGLTKLAIYGIGHIKDERLLIALQNNAVNFVDPPDNQDWFKILVLHQNKYKGLFLGAPRKQSISEQDIPDFFDLVIWGHEHECITEIQQCDKTHVRFLYPGSTVATSLIEAEAKQKHCFIIYLCKQQFAVEPVNLKTARPIIYQQISLFESKIEPKQTKKIEKYIMNYIDKMLVNHYKNDGQHNQLLPMLRLKIEYGQGDYQVEKFTSIYENLKNRIANLKDFLQFYKKKIQPNMPVEKKGKKKKKNDCCEQEDDEDIFEMNDEKKQKIQIYELDKQDQQLDLKLLMIQNLEQCNLPIKDPNLQNNKDSLNDEIQKMDVKKLIFEIDNCIEKNNISQISHQVQQLKKDRIIHQQNNILKEFKNDNEIEQLLNQILDQADTFQLQKKDLLMAVQKLGLGEKYVPAVQFQAQIQTVENDQKIEEQIKDQLNISPKCDQVFEKQTVKNETINQKDSSKKDVQMIEQRQKQIFELKGQDIMNKSLNIEEISDSSELSEQIQVKSRKIEDQNVKISERMNNNSSNKKLTKNVNSNHRHYVSKFEESENIFDIVSQKPQYPQKYLRVEQPVQVLQNQTRKVDFDKKQNKNENPFLSMDVKNKTGKTIQSTFNFTQKQKVQNNQKK